MHLCFTGPQWVNNHNWRSVQGHSFTGNALLPNDQFSPFCHDRLSTWKRNSSSSNGTAVWLVCGDVMRLTLPCRRHSGKWKMGKIYTFLHDWPRISLWIIVHNIQQIKWKWEKYTFLPDWPWISLWIIVYTCNNKWVRYHFRWAHITIDKSVNALCNRLWC